MSEDKNIIHNVIIEQCKKINMTGVRDVKAFDEETVVLETSKGTLTIKGENLAINSFSASVGDLQMQGDVVGLVYSFDSNQKGLIKRIFK
ncbi:MAG: sporulation protein YabP [Clostridia bacterium]|nr:sporulation protein YabP [Clostridia bacterium]